VGGEEAHHIFREGGHQRLKQGLGPPKKDGKTGLGEQCLGILEMSCLKFRREATVKKNEKSVAAGWDGKPSDRPPSG